MGAQGLLRTFLSSYPVPGMSMVFFFLQYIQELLKFLNLSHISFHNLLPMLFHLCIACSIISCPRLFCPILVPLNSFSKCLSGRHPSPRNTPNKQKQWHMFAPVLQEASRQVKMNYHNSLRIRSILFPEALTL